MKKKNTGRKFSRRRFLTITSLTGAGLWTGFSNATAPHVVRGFIQETYRGILKPHSIPNPLSWNSNTLTAAWLGHSSVLINFYGLTVLTDPVLCNRIGADTFLGSIGPKRLVAPALKPNELPKIDLVLLSHAHMDHLDRATLRELPGNPRVVTAHATSDLLCDTKLREPKELKWGEKARISTAAGDMEIQAFEVKHWGARWKVDTYRGYNGYVLSREGKKIIFGGDTAWTESFKALRKKGPFEAAIMPIGAYEPWVCSHCTPEQAVRMADQAGAEHFLPIHFKTFRFGREGTVEPMQRLKAAIDSQRIGWRDVGETFQLTA